MSINKSIRRLSKNQDLFYITILLIAAISIGIYLILTTTLIAKDGISYIHYAQGLSFSPFKIIRDCSDYAPREYTAGYPALILSIHSLANVFGADDSIMQWVYAGQCANLLCRMLAFLPLYFIGKHLVGSHNSFWALLILAILPSPAKIGSDVLRDWPHILALATGFYVLLRTVALKKWLPFGLIGIIAAIGYIIRPVAVQLLVYATVWLTYSCIKPNNNYSLSKSRIFAAFLSLIIGFAILFVPYSIIRGKVLPDRLQQMIKSISSQSNQSNAADNDDNHVFTAAITPNTVIAAFKELFGDVSADLIYFLVPFWIIGFYFVFYSSHDKSPPSFLLIVFVLFNITVLISRYVCISPTLSKRYVLPLVVFTIYFVPIGLQKSGQWIDNFFRTTISKKEHSENKSQQWFFILLVIGVIICLPKLLRPLRADKKYYRQTANWINKNTTKEDVIVASGTDTRLAFYADREFKPIAYRYMPQNANFAIKEYKHDNKHYDDTNEAFVFDGVSDCIDIVSNPIPSVGDFSISGWVYCQGQAGAETDTFGAAWGAAGWSGTAIEGIVLRRLPDGDMEVVCGDGTKHCRIPVVNKITTTNKHKWYHITAVRSYSVLKIYVNAKLKKTAMSEYSAADTDFKIGHSGKLNYHQSYWYGKVKNVRIANKALSDLEIANMYSAEKNEIKSVQAYESSSQDKKRKTRILIYRLPVVTIGTIQ